MYRRRPVVSKTPAPTLEDQFRNTWNRLEIQEAAFLAASDLYGCAESRWCALLQEHSHRQEDGRMGIIDVAKKEVEVARNVMNQSSESAIQTHGQFRDLYQTLAAAKNRKGGTATSSADDFYGPLVNFARAKANLRNVDAMLKKMNPDDTVRPDQYGALRKRQAQRDHQEKVVREHWTSNC